MLNLKSSKSATIASKHYDGVNFYINQVLDFYIDFFKIVNNEHDPKDANRILYLKSALEDNTITTLGRSLGYEVKKKYKIKKTNIVEACENPVNYINKLFNDNRSQFLFFFKELKDCLELIITSKPRELLVLESNFKAKYSFICKTDGSFEEPIRKVLLLNIFNYKKFSNKQGFAINSKKNSYWERYDLSKALNINTCAYCNRIYTFTVTNERGKGIISPSMDHFFDKAKHPLFALSFYNMIPSCTNCNSTLKGRSEFSLDKYVHPYLCGFEENAVFSYRPLDTEAALGESDNLKIYINTKKGSPIEKQIINSKKLFELDTIYSQHADHAQELIRKKIISNDRYLDILRFETYKGLNLSLDEAYRLAFGNYFHDEDFQKRPLAKLTKDLLKELKMI